MATDYLNHRFSNDNHHFDDSDIDDCFDDSQTVISGQPDDNDFSLNVDRRDKKSTTIICTGCGQKKTLRDNPCENTDLPINPNHANAGDQLSRIAARQSLRDSLQRCRRSAAKKRSKEKAFAAQSKTVALKGFNDIDGGLVMRMNYNVNESDTNKKLTGRSKRARKQRAALRRRQEQVVVDEHQVTDTD